MKTTERLLSLTLGCALVACQSEPDPDRPGDPDPADDVTGEPSGGAPAPGTATGPARSVTLLTGHRVTVRGDRAVTVDPPAGGSTAVRSYRKAGHLYVVPVEAALLVEKGRLDRRLFDVTELLAQGYGDDRRTDLPIIVSYGAGAARVSGGAALAAAGARSIRPLASIGGAAMRAPKRDAAAIWTALAGANKAALADGVDAVWLDRVRKTVLDLSAPQIGAPAAWAAGLTGQGVKVAVLDTGIKADHPDFAGRIVDARSFVEGLPEPVDDFGHGTHVASILAGSGAAEDGRYRGVAPDAELLDGKVCDHFGSCFDSWIIAGMEWAAESGAAVVNLSLGGADGPEIDPLEQAINELTELHGTLFVAAAGNQGGCGGPNFLQVGSPSTADAALSVGAVDRDDLIADFSCRGPRVGDGAVKPDITAPGVGIVAARAPGTPVGDFDPVDQFYTRVSGTSMATPHVAGSAALLAQQHPDWRAAELKAALMASSRSTAGLGAFVEGAGRVDVAAAITAEVFTAPASLAMGQAPWPHDDDEPITRTLTYRNRGASPVTLQLSVDARDPSGAPADPGLFTVEPATVTIPAGGEAPVTITADTRTPGPDGDYGGVVVATSGDQTVRTPIAVGKEVESHELTVDVIDRLGAPIEIEILIIDIENNDFLFAMAGAPIRLRRGSYVVDATFFAGDPDRFHAAMLVQPRLELTGPTSITMDARLAEPIAISVPAPTARRALEVVDYSTPTGIGTIGAALLLSDPDGSFDAIYSAQIGPASSEPFITVISSFWAEPGTDPEFSFLDSPFTYNTSFLADEDGFPTGFSRRIRNSELTRIDNDYAQSNPAYLGATADFPGVLSSPGIIWGVSTFFHLPASRSSHYLAEIPDWLIVFRERGEDFFPDNELSRFDLIIPPAGTRTRDRWNQGVIGPSLSFEIPTSALIARDGDEIGLFGPSYYGDRGNHYGFSFLETGAARLFRDGELVGETSFPSFAFFSVPPEPADYRLEVQTVRGGQAQLSTQVDMAWTFRSETGDPRGLPVLAARFFPTLDDRNRAPAGRFFVIPVVISRQDEAPTPRLESLRIDASYDRGQTWQRALVVRVGDVAVALVQHPRRGGGTVSLRARATDRDGNTMDQTIRDAYHLR
jgi:subtilisin family serine protease